MSQFYQQLATLTPEQRALFEKKLAAKGLEKGLQSLGSAPIPTRPTGRSQRAEIARNAQYFSVRKEFKCPGGKA